MADRALLPGKFVWFEHASSDPPKAQAFYRDVLGWTTVEFPVGDSHYPMIFAGETPDTMVGSYAPPRSGARGRWVASVSVDDVDASAAAAATGGGKMIAPPRNVSGVGRAATIADPSGAELGLIRGLRGDPPDPPAIPTGRFVWNELHTPDPEGAVAFYAKVVGFSHRSVPTPAGPYHILSSSGADRGGVTSHLPPGASPHWLPFVHVDDVDRAIERARALGARIPMAPENVMDIGRIAVLVDPTGADLAVMKPRPRANPQSGA
jgi:predicted enzyme related to lactoylglutathione lyase